jgi:hypothetical protein
MKSNSERKSVMIQCSINAALAMTFAITTGISSVAVIRPKAHGPRI